MPSGTCGIRSPPPTCWTRTSSPRSESRYLDVQTTWGQFYGSTVPLDRRVAPAATPVTVMLGLDFKRVFALYKDRLIRVE